MSTSKILFDIKDQIATLRINDPSSLNALSTDMVHEMRNAVAKAPGSARALILCGAGKAFCSGANLASGMGVEKAGSDFDAGAGLEEAINPLILALRDLAIPWISAVGGAAAGVGAALALAGDLIVAGESAYFLEAFCRIGLVPDGGSTYLLTRAAGRVRAMEMMLLGEKISAYRALEWGLINRVVADDQVYASAFELARRLANGPTRTLALICRAAWRATDADLETALKTEREAQLLAARSSDFREGIQAFLEKRPARFTGV